MIDALQSIILTGGTGKLGIFTAKLLVERGYQVILCSREITIAQQTCNQIYANCSSKLGPKHKVLIPAELNLAHEGSINGFLKSLVAQQIIPSALINAAAVDNQDQIEKIKYKEIENNLKINFIGTAYLSSKLATYWQENNIEGVFCTISTLLAYLGCPKSSIYASSKAALESFFINLAVEYGPYSIRSNIVRIAGMLGDLMQAKDSPKLNSLIEADYHNNTLEQKLIPLRRFGAFEEFASLIEFLVSPRSSYITGQAINIDGGLSAVYPGYTP